jgi:hypothetical protein
MQSNNKASGFLGSMAAQMGLLAVVVVIALVIARRYLW